MYELLKLLGRSSSSQGDEPFTTQRLRAAVTPERVAAMRNTTVEEVAAHLKQLTMRMCMLLAGGPHKAHLFSDSIEAVVNEYGEYGLLLHVAADRINLQIGAHWELQKQPPGLCLMDICNGVHMLIANSNDMTGTLSMFYTPKRSVAFVQSVARHSSSNTLLCGTARHSWHSVEPVETQLFMQHHTS